MRVFISYAREDGSPFATRLRDELSSAGFIVWRDIEALVATEDWREQLRAALHSIDAVVVLMTPRAAASQYVTLEWQIAKTLGKPVIAALCVASDIPEELRAAQYRDLSATGPYSREILALTRDLKTAQAETREAIRKSLAAMREDLSLTKFHGAVEKLQRWLNAEAYDLRVISAASGLLEQMKVDILHSGRPSSQILRDAIEGRYILPTWEAYHVFQEQRSLFESVLIQLGKEIRDATTSNALNVPFVLAVMSATEAGQLVDGTAFTDYPEELHHDFAELQEVLAANGLSDWAGRYGEAPQEWRPFAAGDSVITIADVAASALQGIDAELPVTPLFIDVRSLSEERNRGMLRKLRNDGCIVVIDSISMRHPVIQRAFQQTILDAYPKTSVVNIAPLQSAFALVRRMRIFLRLQASDLEFQKRRVDRQEDYGGCREIHEPRELEQWLSDRVRRLFVPRDSRKGVRPMMFRSMGGRG